jgi:hypothetical protein
MLHSDVLRLISLRLGPFHLLINKETASFYNQTWFKDKLEMTCPGLLEHDDYKSLYKKYLKQGTIKMYNYSEFVLQELYPKDNICQPTVFLTKGIKVMPYETGYLILTFDGDLILESGGITILIDTNVVDISSHSYIKKYEWFLLETNGKKRKLDVTPETPFTKVLLNDDIFCALTYDGIYYGGDLDSQILFYPLNNCKDMYWDNNLVVTDDNDHICQLTTGTDGYLFETYLVEGDEFYEVTKNIDFKLPEKVDKFYITFLGDILLIKSLSSVIVYQIKSKNTETITNIKDIFADFLTWFIIQ